MDSSREDFSSLVTVFVGVSLSLSGNVGYLVNCKPGFNILHEKYLAKNGLERKIKLILEGNFERLRLHCFNITAVVIFLKII